MDDNTIRVAAGLRLAALLCRPHSCTHCGEEVHSLATHGLSCRWSEGRHHRHAEMNNIMKRVLTSAKIPSCLEPSGLHQADGKWPDGITVVPWRSGKHFLILTFAPSPLSLLLCTREAGAVAAMAEERKVAKYAHLTPSHLFSPIAVETTGVFGPRTKALLKELGHRMTQTTREEAATTYLIQRAR